MADPPSGIGALYPADEAPADPAAAGLQDAERERAALIRRVLRGAGPSVSHLLGAEGAEALRRLRVHELLRRLDGGEPVDLAAPALYWPAEAADPRFGPGRGRAGLGSAICGLGLDLAPGAHAGADGCDGGECGGWRALQLGAYEEVLRCAGPAWPAETLRAMRAQLGVSGREHALLAAVSTSRAIRPRDAARGSLVYRALLLNERLPADFAPPSGAAAGGAEAGLAPFVSWLERQLSLLATGLEEWLAGAGTRLKPHESSARRRQLRALLHEPLDVARGAAARSGDGAGGAWPLESAGAYGSAAARLCATLLDMRARGLLGEGAGAGGGGAARSQRYPPRLGARLLLALEAAAYEAESPGAPAFGWRGLRRLSGRLGRRLGVGPALRAATRLAAAAAQLDAADGADDGGALATADS